LFSSNIRKLYEQDILNLTAVPNGSRYRLRYKLNYVDEPLRTKWGTWLEGSPALVVYSLQQLKDYQDPAYFPIRLARVVRAYVESADVCVVDLEVGRSASLLPPSVASNHSKNVRDLSAYLAGHANTPHAGISASLIDVKPGDGWEYLEVAKDESADLALFQRTGQYLSGVVSLRDVAFYRVVGVFDRHDWAKGSRIPIAPDPSTGAISLKPSTAYVLAIFLEQPDGSALSGSFEVKADHDIIRFAGRSSFDVASRYDLVTLDLHTPQLGEESERTGSLSITPVATTHGPEVQIPIRLAVTPGKTVATLGLSVVGLALVGLPALWTDLADGLKAIVLVGGAVLTGAVPYIIRRQLPWKL
jgi:hypothetical protein